MLQSRISIKRKHTVKIIKGGVIIIIIQVKKKHPVWANIRVANFLY